MTEHLPECPKSGCAACYEQGKHDCALTHAIRGLKDINRIAARGYDDGQRDALDAAREAVAAVEGGYSVPLEMPVGAFIDAMRREYLSAIDALREKP